jgi:hypothetical protein
VAVKAAVRMKMTMSAPAPVAAAPEPAWEPQEWSRPVSPADRVKAMLAAWIGMIPPRVRLGLGIAAAPLGALLGALAASLILKVRFNAVILPSAFGGVLCGLLSGRKSLYLGIYSAAVGLVAGLIMEHRLAQPPFREEDFFEFLSHIYRAGINPILQIVVGTVVGFFFGIGWGGGRDESHESDSGSELSHAAITPEPKTAAATDPGAVAAPLEAAVLPAAQPEAPIPGTAAPETTVVPEPQTEAATAQEPVASPVESAGVTESPPATPEPGDAVPAPETAPSPEPQTAEAPAPESAETMAESAAVAETVSAVVPELPASETAPTVAENPPAETAAVTEIPPAGAESVLSETPAAVETSSSEPSTPEPEQQP